MGEPLRQRQPRVRDKAYLGWVAKLPCLPTMILEGRQRTDVQVCHLRMSSLKHGKRQTGGAEKPSDVWVIPMRVFWHLDGPAAQHRIGEPAFFDMLGINPFDFCIDLRAAYEAGLSGQVVITRWAARARQTLSERGSA